MRNTFTASVVIASMLIVPVIARAEEPAVNPATHPVMAYDEHQVKTNKADIEKDSTKLVETKMSVEERKAFVETQKADYEKALKDYGSDNDVTKHAKSRYEDAQKSYEKGLHMHNKAHKAMRKDQKELQHAENELKEDKAESTK